MIWHKALGPNRRMDVVDSVVARHFRPVDVVNGACSIGVDHDEEIAWFLQRHGLAGFAASTQGGIGIAQSF